MKVMNRTWDNNASVRIVNHVLTSCMYYKLPTCSKDSTVRIFIVEKMIGYEIVNHVLTPLTSSIMCSGLKWLWEHSLFKIGNTYPIGSQWICVSGEWRNTYSLSRIQIRFCDKSLGWTPWIEHTLETTCYIATPLTSCIYNNPSHILSFKGQQCLGDWQE